jgi:ATP-dependent protease ClpP protease subunit
MENQPESGYLFISTKTLAVNVYDVYYNKHIGNVEQTVELCNLLRSCEDNDVVRIYFNNYGGSMDSAIQIIHAIDDCGGKVIGIADGPVISAASLIFFACDQYEFKTYSYFMFHDPLLCIAGSFSNNEKDLEFAKLMKNKIYTKLYGSYLTTEELRNLKHSGINLYIEGEEMERRIEKLQIKFDDDIANDNLSAIVDTETKSSSETEIVE